MAASTDQPAVVAENVHVRYRVLATGKRATARDTTGGLLARSNRRMREVHALQGVSFVARPGESIGVIGSNGSGKSTLMRAITGLTPVSEGAVWASSRPSMLGVGAALVKELSGERNIILGGLALGYSRTEIEDRFDDIVEFAGLRDFIDMPMRTYSSGMTARLKFAIAASRSHDILIIDEALAVGDKQFRARSEARIREIRDDAGTVFLVSHQMESIRQTCDRVLWIEKGVQVLDGNPDHVIGAYEAHLDGRAVAG